MTYPEQRFSGLVSLLSAMFSTRFFHFLLITCTLLLAGGLADLNARDSRPIPTHKESYQSVNTFLSSELIGWSCELSDAEANTDDSQEEKLSITSILTSSSHVGLRLNNIQLFCESLWIHQDAFYARTLCPTPALLRS